MSWARKSSVGLLGGLLWLGEEAAVCRAEELPAEAVELKPVDYRAGVVAGFTGGILLGNGRGYPNEGEKVGVAQYETVTGLGVSGGGALWLAAALTNWLNAGVGATLGGWKTRNREAAALAFQFRVEVFPLYTRGGRWRDAGLLVTTGLGSFTVDNQGVELVNGGATSAVGAGVFYEPFRFWGLAMGPQLEYGAQFSHAATSYNLVLGWRTAFYSNP